MQTLFDVAHWSSHGESADQEEEIMNVSDELHEHEQ